MKSRYTSNAGANAEVGQALGLRRALSPLHNPTRREVLLGATAITAYGATGDWKIGIAQISLTSKLSENHNKILSYIHKAASERCRVVVFPEGSLTADPFPEQPEIDRCLDEIRKAAAAGKINVLLGGKSNQPEQKNAGNWMVVVNSEGKQILSYDKLYDHASARLPGVFSLEGVGCGAIICADRWLRGIEDLPIFDGARISFELSNNYDEEWISGLGWYWYVPRAIRNSAYVVLANTCGEGKHGHSAVIDPDGAMLASSENEERLLMVNIDPAKASRTEALRREKHPVLSQFWTLGRKGLKGDLPPAEPVQPSLSPETDLRLAAAQMSCSSDVQANVSKIVAMMQKAAGNGADIIAFPELAVTGPREEDIRRAKDETLAQALDRIRETARSAKICAVFGMPHRKNGKLTNAAFVVGPDGGLLTRYDQIALDRRGLFEQGSAASTMWFRVKGVPAVVTIGREGLWSEIAELTALAGAHLHVHITNEAATGRDASLRRLQIWSILASWGTFTATVNAAAPAGGGSAIWEDLRRSTESALAKEAKILDGHEKMAIYSPFSANCLVRAGEGEQILTATERMNRKTDHRSISKDPRMAAWYALGAKLLAPPQGF
jgi:predicted amidohydrolase